MLFLFVGGWCRQYVVVYYVDCWVGCGDFWFVDFCFLFDKIVDFLEVDVLLQFYFGDVDGGDVVLVLYGGVGVVVGENL